MRKIIVTRDPAKINLAVLKLVEQLGDLTSLSALASDAEYARSQAVAAAAAAQMDQTAAAAAKAGAEAAQASAASSSGTAGAHASAAAASAGTSLAAASAASGSATEALAAKTGSEGARDASVTAKDQSQAAKAAAEAARDVVQSSIYIGPTAPTVTRSRMVWVDETANDIKIRNAANTAWVLLSDMIGALEYDRAQTLTDTQKLRAAANIGAVVHDQAQALTAAQILRLWANMGAIAKTGVGAGVYLKLPDGTIIQTGSISTGGAADQRVTFPTAFPAAITAILATVVSDDATAMLSAHVGGFALNAFDIRRRAAFSGGAVGPNSGVGVNWIAIGY